MLEAEADGTAAQPPQLLGLEVHAVSTCLIYPQVSPGCTVAEFETSGITHDSWLARL